MVQIQSSWFPLVDRNPQTFADIPNARPEDFKKAATEQVFHRKNAASGVEVMVLPQPSWAKDRRNRRDRKTKARG